jgi:hypothetical protein
MVKNLIGEQFAYLTVLDFSHKHNSVTYWKCQCKCGNTHVTANSRLLSGRVRSCGCKRKEHTESLGAKRRQARDPVDIGWSYHMASYTHSRNAKQLGFNLTKAEFRSTCLSDCHYCGAAPIAKVVGAYESAKRSNPNTFDHDYYTKSIITVNGIDRIDNNIGYATNNIVPCCAKCNYAKSDTPYNEFVDWISVVYSHLNISSKATV